MKKLILLILLLSLQACMTESRLRKICETCATKTTEYVQDSSWQKRYDSLLAIPVKGPIIILKDNPCAELCDSLGHVKNFSHEVKSPSGITGSIKGDSKTNTIIVDCGSKDSLEVLLKDARIENFHLRQEKQTFSVPQKCDKDHRNWIDHACRWTTLISFIIFAIIFRKQIFSILKKLFL